MIEDIVDSASVDGVAEEAVDEIPLDLAAGRLGRESTDDRRSGAKIRVGILVEFRPTLIQAWKKAWKREEEWKVGAPQKLNKSDFRDARNFVVVVGIPEDVKHLRRPPGCPHK